MDQHFSDLWKNPWSDFSQAHKQLEDMLSLSVSGLDRLDELTRVFQKSCSPNLWAGYMPDYMKPFDCDSAGFEHLIKSWLDFWGVVPQAELKKAIGENEKLNKQYAKQEKTLTEQTSEISGLQKKVSEFQKTSAEQKKEIVEQKKEIAGQKKEISAQKKILMEQKKEIAMKEKIAVDLQKEVAEQKKMITSLKDELTKKPSASKQTAPAGAQAK